MKASIRAAINLENAQHSTGPVTEAGKVRSRMNAWKHGRTSQTYSRTVGAVEIKLAQEYRRYPLAPESRSRPLENNILHASMADHLESADPEHELRKVQAARQALQTSAPKPSQDQHKKAVSIVFGSFGRTPESAPPALPGSPP